MSFCACCRHLFWFGFVASLALVVDRAGQAAPPAKAAKQRVAEEETHPTRLPPYYAGVATEEQRTKIAAVQQEFGPQIRQKRQELKALTDQQEAAINKLLMPKQLKEIEKLKAEARAKRVASGSSDSTDEPEMEDEAPKSRSGKNAKAN